MECIQTLVKCKVKNVWNDNNDCEKEYAACTEENKCSTEDGFFRSDQISGGVLG